MAVGTLLTGGALVRLFGAQLLTLRLFGWLCVTAAITLPYCCLLDKEQRRDNLHWLALTYLLMGYGAFQEFSPGTLSVLLLSALWVTQSPIVLGLAVVARFPNILALLILIPLWKKRSLWNIPIAAGTAGIVYLLGYLFLTPAPLDAAMTSHDLWDMCTKLWENSGKLLGFMLMAVGVLAFRDKRHAGWFVGAALVLFIVYAIKPYQWYNTDLTYLISALVLVITVYRYPGMPKERLIGALLLGVATLGTDTAWLKLFPAVLCLVPVALTQFDKDKQFYFAQVLIMLCAVTMVRMTTNSVGQSNLTKVQTVSSVSPYKGISIRQAEEQRLRQYIADYDSLQLQIRNHKSQIMALGQECHLMRAVTGCEAARYNEFWSNIFDSVYTARYATVIEQEHPIVFCSFSPQFKTKPQYKDKESRMEQMLLEKGYRVIDRSQYKYMIYIPQDNE